MEKKDSTSKLDLKNEKLGLETSISSQPTNHIEDGNERWRQMSFDDNDHSGYDLVKHTFNCFHSKLQLSQLKPMHRQIRLPYLLSLLLEVAGHVLQLSNHSQKINTNSAREKQQCLSVMYNVAKGSSNLSAPVCPHKVMIIIKLFANECPSLTVSLCHSMRID